jgi:hypothetical protein
VKQFFDGMRTRDTTLMRSTVAPGAVLMTLTRAGETKISHCGVDSFLLRKGPDG